MADNATPTKEVTFNELIARYNTIQAALVEKVKALGSNMDSTNPGAFILIQFEMAQVTQVGESISNLVSQLNGCISATIRNLKTS